MNSIEQKKHALHLSKQICIVCHQGLLPYIHNMFYTYHTERVENAIDDIGRMLEVAIGDEMEYQRKIRDEWD
ncbi:hypothetical protein FACS189491_03790 [Spirochaetia bacterium]|nr:hypothetical protein FACS189491_03790 [Spirochaetia bacterium]